MLRHSSMATSTTTTIIARPATTALAAMAGVLPSSFPVGEPINI